MSVLSYLQKRASDAVLSPGENASIATSIGALKARLDVWFGTTVSEHFQFGSSTRGTILPRKMDGLSDIDYMVVFSDGGYTSQTYLDRLKRFAENYYSRSEIRQSFPTVKLELNHIIFELVPATKNGWGGYQIPNDYGTWQSTDPNGFNASLTAKNNACGFLMKPTVRLAKFWNANAAYVFDSYAFERSMVDAHYFFCNNQKDYLFTVFDGLSATTGVQWKNDRITRAKAIVAQVRDYEKRDMPISAENEVKKLIPE